MEKEKRPTSKTLDLAVLPLRDMVLFPGAIRPLAMPGDRAAHALERLEHGLAAVFAQRAPEKAATTMGELHAMGVLVHVHQSAPLADGSQVLVVAHATDRVRPIRELQREPFLVLRVEVVPEPPVAADDPEVGALVGSTRELAAQVIAASPLLSNDLIEPILRFEEPGALADFVAGLLPALSVAERQQLLETLDPKKRLRQVHEDLVKEMDAIKARRHIEAQVEEKVGEAQRQFFLREQLHAIRKELGESDDVEKIVDELRARLDAASLPEEAAREAKRELSRLGSLSSDSAEASVVRTYLDWLATLPWGKSTAIDIDLERAQKILDEDHHDLAKVKDRILDYLAVHALRRDLKAPLLCFVGPPGVGKTSVGKSIARASGRAFVRISLGGIRDEAEIRGHRRTYVGALPGQIVHGLRRAGTSDPVFMLDEIDKLGADFRGDPAAALMEALDPEQNGAFRDHYLDVPLDLSRVLFITTANLLEPIPAALRDRMEVIELPGYSDADKLAIAKGFLVPRQIGENGLDPAKLSFEDAALDVVIRSYTREAGVRNLERAIAKICRKEARAVASTPKKEEGTTRVTPAIVRERLGAPPFDVGIDLAARTRTPGVAVALAWTPAGGDVLLVEAVRMPRDRGDVYLTGNMGGVMQESARAALSWVRANAWRYGIPADVFAKSDVHVHVPSGATPKDGPSAGIVLVTALVSAFSERPIRPLVAMSGEVTLSGAILPIGGVHEKVLAARRNGVREVVLPARNEDGVAELDEEIRRGLVFRFVSTIEEGVALAFGEPREIDTRRARDERNAFAEATPIAAENAPPSGGTRLDLRLARPASANRDDEGEKAMANVQIQKNVPPKQTPARPEPQAEIAPRDMLAWDPFRMMRSLLAWDPFREMAAMPMTMPAFSPAFDVKETAEGYAFTADVPGMKQSDIEVSMTGNRLSISGKRETEKEEKGEKYYSCERTFGSFLRSFTLPDDADIASVSADLRDGVLTIAVKKTPESKPKKVEINQPKS